MRFERGWLAVEEDREENSSPLGHHRQCRSCRQEDCYLDWSTAEVYRPPRNSPSDRCNHRVEHSACLVPSRLLLGETRIPTTTRSAQNNSALSLQKLISNNKENNCQQLQCLTIIIHVNNFTNADIFKAKLSIAWRGVSAERPRNGINIETTRCRLLCHNLDCDAEFFGDDLAFYRHSSISCGVCESPQQRLSQENSLRLALRWRCKLCQITLTSVLEFNWQRYMTNCPPNGRG